MGAVASINHAHVEDKEEKHEDVHKVVSKLPQYGIVGESKYNETITNGSVSMKKLREIDPYLKYGGFYTGDVKDTDDFKYIAFTELPMFGQEHKSLLARTLTMDRFEKMKDLKTSTGYTFSNAIMTGVVTPPLLVGVTAGDEESWEVFKDLYYPIVKAWHGYDASLQTQYTDLDSSKLSFSSSQLELFNTYVLSTRVRAVRNISGFALPSGTLSDDRAAVEGLLKRFFSSLSGDLAGTYYELGALTKEQDLFLRTRGYLFQAPTPQSILTGAGAARSWPDNRGIFNNETQTALAWVNEEDHCRLISMELGGDVLSVFQRFSTLSDKLKACAEADGKKIMWSDRLGYLGTCPSNLGTALRASVLTMLPEFRRVKDQELLSSICSSYGLAVKAAVIAGERKENLDQRYDISNRERLGWTEVKLVQKLIDGVTTVLRYEEKLAKGFTVAALEDRLAL